MAEGLTKRPLAAFLVLVFLGAAAAPAPAGGRVLTDQAGRRVELPYGVERVVSLAPSVTEMVYAVEGRGLIVGATRFSDTPREALDLPRVGTYVHPELERIVALAPDLVIGVKDGNPVWVPSALKRVSVPFLAVDPKDVKGVLAAIRLVGRAIGREEEGERLAASLEARIQGVADRVKGLPRTRVFVQEGVDPIIAAGGSTYIDDVIRLAGGENVLGGFKGWPKLNPETVIAARPQVMIIVGMERNKNPGRAAARWREWPQIPAVKHKRVHLVESNLYDRPSPRVAELLEEVASLLHPEAFER